MQNPWDGHQRRRWTRENSAREKRFLLGNRAARNRSEDLGTNHTVHGPPGHAGLPERMVFRRQRGAL